MTSKILNLGLGLALTIAAASLPGLASAGVIDRACRASDRNAASPQLCGCIQKVANSSLTRSDRKLAATFFEDPQKAQEIRTSDRPKHEAFWDRYQEFGQQAARTCG